MVVSWRAAGSVVARKDVIPPSRIWGKLMKEHMGFPALVPRWAKLPKSTLG